MVKLLSQGTIIFFMDSAASSAVMREALKAFNGTFLYPPTLVISRNFQIEVSEELKKSMLLQPAQIAEVEFFVWEKIPDDPPTPTACPQESGKQCKKLRTCNSEGEIGKISVVAEESTEVPRKSKSVANNSFELDSTEPLIVPTNRRGTFSSSNSASTEVPHIFKPVAVNSAISNLPDNQLNGIMTGIPLNSAGVQISNASKSSNSSIPNRSKADQCSSSFAEELWPNSKNAKHLQDFASFLNLSLTNKRIDVSIQNGPPIIDFLMWLFMEVYEKEINKYKANQFLSLSTVFELSSSTYSANYNDTHIRCAYMYRYATCHTLLIKGCIARFLSEYSDAGKLLNIWKANPFFCSLSLGPCLDYIAFRLAVLERTQLPFQVIKVRTVTSCTEWKSTVDILSEVMQVHNVMPDLKLDSSRVLNGSVFKQWPSKSKKYFQKSYLIFMFKSLNLEVKEKEVDTCFLLELVNVLKPGAVILFIDTLYGSFVMQGVLAKCPGTYLYGPVFVACNNIPIGKPEEMKTVLGVIPVQSDQAHFFVWKKDSNTLNPSKNHTELKQNCISSEIKSNCFKSCGSSLKLHHKKGPAQFQKVVSSASTTNVSSTSSSRSPPTLNWRVRQEDSPPKQSSFSVKVGNKHKIRDYLSGSQNYDVFKMSALSDQSRPSSDSTSFSPCEKELDPRETVRSVDHKTSIKLKVSTDSSCIFTSPDIVNSNFECGVIDSVARITKPETSTTDLSSIFSNANVENSDFDCDTIETIVPFIKSKVPMGSSCKASDGNAVNSDFECGAVEPLTSIIESKVPMDSSCKASDGNVVNRNFECDAVEPMTPFIKSVVSTNSSWKPSIANIYSHFNCDTIEPIAPIDCKSTLDSHSSFLGSAVTEHSLVSKLSSEIVGTKKILSDNQVIKINSLIERIDKLASSIENDYHAPSKMGKKEESVNITEINILTKRINQVVSILESNINNQNQNSIS